MEVHCGQVLQCKKKKRQKTQLVSIDICVVCVSAKHINSVCHELTMITPWVPPTPQKAKSFQASVQVDLWVQQISLHSTRTCCICTIHTNSAAGKEAIVDILDKQVLLTSLFWRKIGLLDTLVTPHDTLCLFICCFKLEFLATTDYQRFEIVYLCET